MAIPIHVNCSTGGKEGNALKEARNLIQKDTNFEKLSDPGDQVYFSKSDSSGKRLSPGLQRSPPRLPPSLLGSTSEALPEAPTPQGAAAGRGCGTRGSAPFRIAAPLSGNGRTTSGPTGGPGPAEPSPAAPAGTPRPGSTPRDTPPPRPAPVPLPLPSEPPSLPPPPALSYERCGRWTRPAGLRGGSSGAAPPPPPAHRYRRPQLRPRPARYRRPGTRRAAPRSAPRCPGGRRDPAATSSRAEKSIGMGGGGQRTSQHPRVGPVRKEHSESPGPTSLLQVRSP
ncbi:basic proline-rich protein-like [Parus major]|uniref:basic proline-rich protein-like n=1 Tax=Parus major TaxID=9157 RepID=UPI000771058C|nr:basic proline-rich protein-like [Parus major]